MRVVPHCGQMSLQGCDRWFARRLRLKCDSGYMCGKSHLNSVALAVVVVRSRPRSYRMKGIVAKVELCAIGDERPSSLDTETPG